MSLKSDFYALTMWAGYHKQGIADRQACFTYFYRRPPTTLPYIVFTGLDTLMKELAPYIEKNWLFNAEELRYLETLGIFDHIFLGYLANQMINCQIISREEGSFVYPNTPILRVEGPLGQCQFIETLLLNTLNFQSLIATTALEIVEAAQGRPVIEFGFRRAHGPAALYASRAAYIGGCQATSNVEAGMKFGIPIKGTMAHSWVQVFPTEKEAFKNYLETYGPSILLVDTYDVKQGIINAVDAAIEVAPELCKRGMMSDRGEDYLSGIRIDSGDLVKNSKMARHLLNERGFYNTKIIVSNDLDAPAIKHLLSEGAPIDMFGVGTRLVTGYPSAHLGGVYKLSAIQDKHDKWQPRMKISASEPAKSSLPGRPQVESSSTKQEEIFNEIDNVHAEFPFLVAPVATPITEIRSTVQSNSANPLYAPWNEYKIEIQEDIREMQSKIEGLIRMKEPQLL